MCRPPHVPRDRRDPRPRPALPRRGGAHPARPVLRRPAAGGADGEGDGDGVPPEGAQGRVGPAGDGTKKDADNVSGLEHLATADLWVGSANKRTFPSDEQLAHLKKHLAAGKPFVGYRAASHVFQNWLEVDQQVFGATYGSHHLLNKEKNPGLNIELTKGAADHPVLKGLRPPKPSSGS